MTDSRPWRTRICLKTPLLLWGRELEGHAPSWPAKGQSVFARSGRDGARPFILVFRQNLAVPPHRKRPGSLTFFRQRPRPAILARWPRPAAPEAAAQPDPAG